MAARYWVAGGASANWDATGNTNWGTASNTQDNAAVPTAADDVYFDGVGTGAANCTISSASVARSVNFTGYANTLTHNAGFTLTIGDATAGAGNIALKMVAGMTYTLGSVTTSAIFFGSTSATVQDVDFAGKTTGNVTFNASSNGSWKLTGSHTVGTGTTVTFSKGTLDTNGQTLSYGVFAANSSNVRTLTLGASAIAITGSGWNFATTTNLTFNANTSVITISGAAGVLFNAGTAGSAVTFNEVKFTGSGAQAITGGGTYAILNRTGTAVKTDTFSLSGNITVTGTLTLAGNSTTNRLLVFSNTLGTARTITNSGATMTWSNVDFKDIDLGTAYDASAITGLSGDCGGNSNITFTTGATQYGVGMSGGASWSNSAVWGTTSGGSGGRVPLPQDDVVLDANSFAIP